MSDAPNAEQLRDSQLRSTAAIKSARTRIDTAMVDLRQAVLAARHAGVHIDIVVDASGLTEEQVRSLG